MIHAVALVAVLATATGPTAHVDDDAARFPGAGVGAAVGAGAAVIPGLVAAEIIGLTVDRLPGPPSKALAFGCATYAVLVTGSAAGGGALGGWLAGDDVAAAAKGGLVGGLVAAGFAGIAGLIAASLTTMPGVSLYAGLLMGAAIAATGVTVGTVSGGVVAQLATSAFRDADEARDARDPRPSRDMR